MRKEIVCYKTNNRFEIQMLEVPLGWPQQVLETVIITLYILLIISIIIILLITLKIKLRKF